MAYEDLLKDTSAPDTDANYFLVTVTDLEPNKLYPLQFRWKYNDGSFGPWSAVKTINTPTETVPQTPDLGASDVVGGNGFIKITWNGNDSSGSPIQNIDRVNIHISGGTFGSGTQVVDFFKTAGTKTIVAAPGTYIVQLKSITVANTTSFFSLSRTVEVTGTENVISDPEDPSVPTASAGKASIIVSWDGKNSSNSDFTAGSFFGAKVYVGTSAGFIPNDNNWVHTLNFANGYNQVSIGINTVIDKTSGEVLDYDTNYYIKIGTLNQNGETTGNFISASGNPIQVDKTDFSEIEAGILSADAYIQAGASEGQRVVISGGLEPFVIYGSDGTTKLLEFDSLMGGTGALKIIGSGTFSGSLNIGTPASGLYPFSVSSTGVLRAVSGLVGGLTLAADGIQNSGGTFKLDSDGKARFGSIDISPTIGIYHSSGNFVLGANGNLSLTGTVYANGGTIGGWTIPLNTPSVLTANNLTLDSATGTIYAGNSAGSHIQLSNSSGLRQMNNATTEGNFKLTPSGDLTIRGTVQAVSGYIGTDTNGWYIDAYGVRDGTEAQYATSKTIKQSDGSTWTTDQTFLYSARAFSDTNSVVFQIGETDKFSVTKAGNLRASNAIISGQIRAADIIGSKFYVKNNESDTYTDYIFNTGEFSLGGGRISGTSSSVTINGANLILTDTSGGDDGTAGDPTVVRIMNTLPDGTPAGKIVTGRAIWYGGNNTPTNNITSRYAFNTSFGGSQGYINGQPTYTSSNPGYFSTGDLYMTII